MSPRISVVLPTLARHHFLAEAVRSVDQALIQSSLDRSEAEIVVVDDAHDESTARICAELSRGLGLPIRCLRTLGGPRSGPSAARNQGIRAAAAPVVYLLDDDDIYLPHRFAVSLPMLESGEYEAILERSVRGPVEPGAAPEYETGPDGPHPNPFRYLLQGGPDSHVTPGATSFTRSFFDRVDGFDESLRYVEDGEYLLRLCLSGRVALVGGNPVVRIRIHGDNSSRADRLERWHSLYALSALHRKIRARGPSEDQQLLRRQISAKLDFALSDVRRRAPSYGTRLVEGLRVLRAFDWRCASAGNLKSLGVWLFWRRTP